MDHPPSDSRARASRPKSPEDPALLRSLRLRASGERVFNRFRLRRELGAGGMAVVWLAQDDLLQIEAALKFLPGMVASDADALHDLRREITRGLKLTHDGIVRVYDLHEDPKEGLAAIAMEYVEGASLTDLKSAQPGRCFEAREIARWTRDLCEVLTYVHEKAKIVHRDLKPRNLMITREGELKVADFGIAATLCDSHSRLTQRPDQSGTPVYMSPQQAAGRTPRVSDDIYSLGATLYELLTSKPPFFRGGVAVVLSQIASEVPPTMAERRAELGVPARERIPEAWEKTIAACLAKNPDERPRDSREVAARLGLCGAARAEGTWAAQPPVPSPAPPAPAKSRRRTNPPSAAAPRMPGEDTLSSGATIGGPARRPAPEMTPPRAAAPPAPPPPPFTRPPEHRPPAPPAHLAARPARGGRALGLLSAAALLLAAGLALAWWRQLQVPAPENPSLVGVAANPAPPPPERPEKSVSPPKNHEATPAPAPVVKARPMVPFYSPPQVTRVAAPTPALKPAPPPAISPSTPTPYVALATPSASKMGGYHPTPSAQVAATPAPPPGPQRATASAPWFNSLGMKFVPVPISGGDSSGKLVLFSVWETRTADFAAYLQTSPRSWSGSSGGSSYPAGYVSFAEAQAFCAWLDRHEQAAGLPSGWHYRLPSDHEWSCAAGLKENAQASIKEKVGQFPEEFPWGKGFPPPAGTGNFFPLSTARMPAPVGSFTPNGFGLYDLSGNVMEWCDDRQLASIDSQIKVLRGGSFKQYDTFAKSPRSFLLSSARFLAKAPSEDSDKGFRCVLVRD